MYILSKSVFSYYILWYSHLSSHAFILLSFFFSIYHWLLSFLGTFFNVQNPATMSGWHPIIPLPLSQLIRAIAWGLEAMNLTKHICSICNRSAVYLKKTSTNRQNMSNSWYIIFLFLQTSWLKILFSLSSYYMRALQWMNSH